MLGDFDLDGSYEYHPAWGDGGMRHFPMLAPSFHMPLAIWVYAFVATVVLVNLLIAQMSSTYERVKENSAEYWEFSRVDLVKEYKDNKDAAPPPLNLLYYLYYIPLRLCGTIKPPSRGFKWPRRRQGAAEVYKIGTMARKSFLEQEAKASHRAVAHQVDLLHRGQRVLEAEQRSQFESITGRIEAIKNEVRSVRMWSAAAGSTAALSNAAAADTRLAQMAGSHMAAAPAPSPAQQAFMLQSNPGAIGYGFAGQRPEFRSASHDRHRPAPSLPGNAVTAPMSIDDSTIMSGAQQSSQQRQQQQQQLQQQQLQEVDVARAALASLPPS